MRKNQLRNNYIAQLQAEIQMHVDAACAATSTVEYNWCIEQRNTVEKRLMQFLALPVL